MTSALYLDGFRLPSGDRITIPPLNLGGENLPNVEYASSKLYAPSADSSVVAVLHRSLRRPLGEAGIPLSGGIALRRNLSTRPESNGP